jgi:adenylate cyclase
MTARLGSARTWQLAAAAGALAGLLALSGALEFLELKSLDLRFRFRGPRPPGSPIVIIAIDEDSFDELNLTWPFPRALHAQLLDLVSQGRPAVIGLDMLFVEPSVLGPDDDRALAAAIARAGNVVLAAALTDTESDLGRREDLNPPLPAIRAGAAAFGFVNLTTDRDAFVRSGPLRRPYQDGSQESFTRRLYELAGRAGLPARPLPASAEVGINFRGPAGTFPIVPYYRVLNGEAPPEAFRDRVVLVGSTTPVLHDEFPTPFAGHTRMPGVEIQANLLDTLLQGRPIHRLARPVAVILAVGGAVVATAIAVVVRPVAALLGVLALVTAYAAIAHGAFVGANLWLDLVPGPAGAGLGYGITVVIALVREQREKRRLSRFFSPDVVRAILATHGDDALAGRRRRITVLFSDIRGFTTLSERLEPEQVVALLRDYLTAATAIVFRHGGSVDKYIGDAIMALYGAPFDQPDHAARAVRTALDLQRCVEALSAQWVAHGGQSLRNGVGIHTGDAVVGAIGSRQRLEFTAIGDTVNVASRLEGLTKDFGAPVIISQTTYQEVADLFRARPLGSVRVKGREVAVDIYAVDGNETRRAPRVALEAKVTIEEEGVIVVAQLLDISRIGLAVASPPRAIDADRIVRLTIDLPGLLRPIEAEGRVARQQDDRVGFAFTDLPPDEATRLDEVLARYGPSPGGPADPLID